MTDSKNPSPSSPKAAAGRQGEGELLTEAQREFAKLLGRLLARRWAEEQRGQQGPASSEARN
jgi:hypothetical protein